MAIIGYRMLQHHYNLFKVYQESHQVESTHQGAENFPAKAPLEIVSIDVLGEVIINLRVNRYVIFINDSFTILMKKIPTKNESEIEVAKHFVH